MNPFLKAGILTIIVVILAFLLVSQIDSSRADELRSDIREMAYENQAQQILGRYSEVLANKPGESCPYLESLRKKQLDKTYSLAVKIQDYEVNSVINREYEELKKEYLLSLSDSYISAFKNLRECGIEEVPLAFFYREKTSCPDCSAQDIILGNVAKRCKGLRIYAFPSDTSLEPVAIFVDRYGIVNAPAIAINDKTVSNGKILPEERIVKLVEQSGASCS